MQTVLVPTDFSDTAKNAALYAVEFGRAVGAKKTILLNAYHPPLSVDPTAPVFHMFSLDDIKQASTEGLNHLKDHLIQFTGQNITLEVISEFGSIPDAINQTCQGTNTDINVMGITGGSGLDVLIGSNTITVADNATIPVLIVPATCMYKPIRNIVLVIDMKKPPRTLSLLPVKKLLDDTNAKLFLLNIDEHKIDDDNEIFSQQKLLEPYHAEYHHIYSKDFADAANEFAESNQVDLLITVSKKHGFFDNIFRPNHTKQLAFHTHIPLMCIHEERT